MGRLVMSLPERFREYLLEHLPFRLADFRRGEGARYLQIPVRAGGVAEYDPEARGPQRVGYRVVTVDLAEVPEVVGGTIEEREQLLQDSFQDLQRSIEADLQRSIEADLAQAFAVPLETGPGSPGRAVITAVEEMVRQDLRAECDADGGYLVPPDVANGIREATFRGVPIRYRPPEPPEPPEPPDSCDCPSCAIPWPDPIRAADPDAVVERSIDATCTPWELADAPPARARRTALPWDEFLRQSAALIDEQERRKG